MPEKLFIGIPDIPSMPYRGRRNADAVLIDCHHAGVSGDMLLAALIDLGADQGKVRTEIKRCTQAAADVSMELAKVKRASIVCTKVDFRITDPSTEIDMADCFGRSSDPWIRRTSAKVLETLVSAESKVHGRRGMDHPHLHEVGRVDAVADIVGCLAAWRALGLDKAESYSTRVALGGGHVVFSHGTYPVPAPATLEILKDVPVVLGGDRELTTPTGAALLVNLVEHFLDRMDLVPIDVGWGAGSDQGGFLNATRVVRGLTPAPVGDLVDVLETSVDDVTPEALGFVTERLLKAGALDVGILPCVMKKGRPGHLIRVIATRNESDGLCDMLLAQTGSLGARINRDVERRKLRRAVRSVTVDLEGASFEAKLKVGMGRDGRVLSLKPEYSSVVEICRRTGLEFPKVHRAIMEAATKSNSL